MATPVTYTLKEVKEHRGRESCWIVIDGKVYDVTKYLDQHPGGDQIIIDESGGNATEAFDGHSADAKEILKTLMIGDLNPEDVKLLAGKNIISYMPGLPRISTGAVAAVAAPTLAVALIGVIIFLNRK